MDIYECRCIWCGWSFLSSFPEDTDCGCGEADLEKLEHLLDLYNFEVAQQ